MLVGQTVQAPGWMRGLVSERIEQALDNRLQINFGTIGVVVDETLRPQVKLGGVVLTDPEGVDVARFDMISASLGRQALSQGRLRAQRVRLSGVSATLRRSADGSVALLVGDTSGPAGEAGGVLDLIRATDRSLDLPLLSALTSVQIDGVRLDYEDARAGTTLVLDGGEARLTRSGDDLRAAASFGLLGRGAEAGRIAFDYETRRGAIAATFGVTIGDVAAGDIAGQSPALGWLEALQAPVTGALRGSVEEDGAIGPLSATLSLGAGALQPTPGARPIPFEEASAYLTYDPVARRIDFDDISVDSALGKTRAQGRAFLGETSAFLPESAVGQFALNEITIAPGQAYPAPIALRDATVDVRMIRTPFRLDLGEVYARIGDSALRLDGRIGADADGWDVAVDAEIDSMTPARLVDLWPAGFAPGPRKWVDTNVQDGMLSGITVAWRSQPGGRPDVYADFDVDDAQIRFNKSQPLIEGAAGHVSLVDERLVATLTHGQIAPHIGGPLDVAGSAFIVPDVGIRKAAPGVVRIAANGSVPAAMALLNRPPIRVLRNSDLPEALAEGRIAATGTLAFPLKVPVTFDEIRFHVDGRITDVSSDVLVPGQVVTADALRIKGDQSEIRITGAGLLGAVPLDVEWRQPLGAGQGGRSRVSGTVELSQTLLETLSIGLPPGTVTGQGSADFTLDLARGAPPDLTFRSELQGVGLSIPSLGWTKRPEAVGRLDLSGRLGSQPQIDRLVLDGSGLSATGTVLTRPAGAGLERAALTSLRLGDWLEGSVELIGRGAGRAPDIRVRNGRLDLRRAQFGSGGEGGAPGRLEIDRATVQLNETVALTDVRGQFTLAGGLRGDFNGNVNGSVPVRGRITPEAGRSAVWLQADDAGGALRAAGLLRQGRGGHLDLTLTPRAADPGFDGALKLRDLRVRDAPAIASLLNAISVVGLIDEMSGQGILFSDVQARFRVDRERLTLFEASATGPSIGVSMDGFFDMVRQRFDMQGVISPIYLLNSVGSILTRQGEGLFGFAYTLRGAPRDPQVQVNPLSALAPGALREIFRNRPPDDGSGAAETTRDRRAGEDQGDGLTGGR
jgi:hypothetical protein